MILNNMVILVLNYVQHFLLSERVGVAKPSVNCHWIGHEADNELAKTKKHLELNSQNTHLNFGAIIWQQ